MEPYKEECYNLYENCHQGQIWKSESLRLIREATVPEGMVFSLSCASCSWFLKVPFS